MTLITINPFRVFASPAGYDADAEALFAARAAQDDVTPVAYRQAISDWLVAMKAVSGWWANVIQVWTCAGTTKVNSARLSIKGNNFTSSGFVDADINPKLGSVGDGLNKSWSIGYSGTVAGTGQNNFHTYGYFSSTGTGANPFYGNGNAASGAWGHWRTATRSRSTTVDSLTAANSGGFGMNRSVAASYQRLHGGVISTVTRTSQTPSGNSYLVLGSAGTSVVRQDATVLIWAMGPAITTLADYGTPVSNFIAALNAI